MLAWHAFDTMEPVISEPPLDTAAEEAGVSVSEFEKLMSEAGYKVPETV